MPIASPTPSSARQHPGRNACKSKNSFKQVSEINCCHCSSRKKAFEPSVAPGDRHGIGDAQSTSPNTAIPSLKSPPFHTTESSGFDTSSQSLRPVSNAERVLEADDMPERASTGIDSERDEGDNSHAFAVALDLDIAPAADSSLFYSGQYITGIRRSPLLGQSSI